METKGHAEERNDANDYSCRSMRRPRGGGFFFIKAASVGCVLPLWLAATTSACTAEKAAGTPRQKKPAAVVEPPKTSPAKPAESENPPNLKIRPTEARTKKERQKKKNSLPEALAACTPCPLPAERAGGVVEWHDGKKRPRDPRAPRMARPLADLLRYGHVNVSVVGENLPPDQQTNGDTVVEMKFKATGLRHKDRRWPDLACFHDKVLLRRPGKFSVSLKMMRDGRKPDRLEGRGVVPPPLYFVLDEDTVAAGPNATLRGTFYPAIENAYYDENGRLEVVLLRLDGPRAKEGERVKVSAPELDTDHAWRMTFALRGLQPGRYAVKLKFYDRRRLAASTYRLFRIVEEVAAGTKDSAGKGPEAKPQRPAE